MRIIAGKYRGRVLKAFRGEEIRPTADRVKESLFQILSSRLPSSDVLDLFAGSGALGLEALSRGAERVVFNDVSPESLSVLRANLSLLKVKAEIMERDFSACLMSVAGKFDLIFADPPYRAAYTEEILRLTAMHNLLKEGGLVIVESEREEVPIDGWTVYDARSYGRTKITMFTRSNL